MGAVVPQSGQRYDIVREAVKTHTFLPSGMVLAGGKRGARTFWIRYILPLQEPQPEHGSRESTVSEADEDNDPTRYPGLQLTFHSGSKASQGFMIGTDENCCDIILPKSNSKISRRHCCITFDEKRHIRWARWRKTPNNRQKG